MAWICCRNTRIYPCLFYCNSVWAAISNKNLNALQVLQKRIIRVISYKNIGYSSAEIFKELFFLNLQKNK